jgi:hypothetical protein
MVKENAQRQFQNHQKDRQKDHQKDSQTIQRLMTKSIMCNDSKTSKRRRRISCQGPNPNMGSRCLKASNRQSNSTKANGNTAWQDAIDKEMWQLECFKGFDFKPTNYAIWAMVIERQSGQRLSEDKTVVDLWRETRFKAKGTIGCRRHLVDKLDNHIYFLTFKGVSFKI